MSKKSVDKIYVRRHGDDTLYCHASYRAAYENLRYWHGRGTKLQVQEVQDNIFAFYISSRFFPELLEKFTKDIEFFEKDIDGLRLPAKKLTEEYERK